MYAFVVVYVYEINQNKKIKKEIITVFLFSAFTHFVIFKDKLYFIIFISNTE